MSKQITFLTVLAMFFAFNATATVWRVNNNPGVDADFSNLQTAIDDANVQPFDTLYVEGSSNCYGGISVSKPVTLFGTGYFLNENDTTQSLKKSSTLNSAKFNSGAEGAVLCGFKIIDDYSSSAVYISTDSVVVIRNQIVQSNIARYGIYILSSSLSRIRLECNYISITNYNYPCSAIKISGDQHSIVIRNNYLDGSGNGTNYSIESSGSNTLVISNNIFGQNLKTNSSLISNNIMISGDVTGSDNLYVYNIGSEQQFGNEYGNQQNVDMSIVFVDYTPSVDNDLILAVGSPAIGAGFEGMDCGIFGGSNPYVLSGIPPIPSIFEITLQNLIGSVNTPIEVNLKAKSNQ